MHFTILRPPEKQDGTPIRELALIAFPSRELFEVKLHEFDLVIFDRYSRRGLLPLPYLDNVAAMSRRAERSSRWRAEFAHPLSLYRTPLARVCRVARPAWCTSAASPRGSPKSGNRHPVTGGLEAAWATATVRPTSRRGGAGSAISTSRSPTRRC